MKLIRAEAFLSWDSIPRCQDVAADDHWGHGSSRDVGERVQLYVVAISHRWETEAHPDPRGTQLREAQRRLRILLASPEYPANLSYVQRCATGHLTSEADVQKAFHPTVKRTSNEIWDQVRNDTKTKFTRQRAETPLDASKVGIFYDYASLFQRPRTSGEDLVFRYDLEQMDELFAGGAVLVLTDDKALVAEYMQRAWCFVEYLIAISTGSLIIQDDQPQLQNWLLREIRQLLEKERRGSGSHLVARHWAAATERALSIARHLRKLMSHLEVTNGDDKSILYTVLVCFFERFNPDWAPLRYKKSMKYNSPSSNAIAQDLETIWFYEPPSGMELSKKAANSFDMDFSLEESIRSELDPFINDPCLTPAGRYMRERVRQTFSGAVAEKAQVRGKHSNKVEKGKERKAESSAVDLFELKR